MEDAQGDVGSGSSCGVTESPLSGNFPSETLVENISSENQVEETYEEGDGGEIMVEVVGSDVFVDGVRGHKEGEFEPGEVGDLEGQWENKEEPGTQNFSEAMDVSTEGDGNKMGESEVGLSESKDERNLVATEEVGVSFCKSVDVEDGAVCALLSRGVGDSGDEVWKPGIEAMTVSSSVATESVTVQTEEAMETISVVVDEEKTIKDEAVDKDSAELVTPETLNHSLEADVRGEVEVAEKEEVLPSNDNATSDDHLSADSVVSRGTANEAHDGQIAPSGVSVDPNIEDPENVKVGGINSVVGKVGLDNASVGGETLANGSPKDGSSNDNAEPANTAGDSVVEAKFADEKEVSAAESKDQILESDAESKDQILESDALIPDVQDENQGSSNELHGVKFEANDQIDSVSHTIPESIQETSLASERGETIGAEFDVVLDFKDGASNIDLPDLSCVANDECLKTDGDVDSDMVYQNHVISSEPNEMADEGDAAELNKDKGLNIELQADTEGNQRNTMSLDCPGGEEIVEADTGVHVNEPVITSTVGEVMDDRKIAISQVEAVNEIDSEIPEQSLERQGNAEIPALDTSSENMDLTETSECPKVETADVLVAEDHVECNNPVVDSEVRFENVVEESCLPQNMEQEVFVQTIETSNQDIDKLESINVMPNEVASITTVSDSTQVSISLEITEKAELHVSTASSSLLENDADTEQVSDEMVASHKRKHTSEDDSESRKERSLTELMGNGEYSLDAESGRKRRALDPLADVSDERESVTAAKISTSTSQPPKPSFRIGECIQRVASQLTGSTSLVKGNNDEAVIDGSPKYEHSEPFSVNEMLSQLKLVAQDPKKGHNLQENNHTFLLGFRSSITLNRRGRKKKGEETTGGSGEEFEFDDVSDSYWTDRIVQNHSEEQQLHNSENGAANLQVAPFGAEKSVKPGRKPNSRKRYSTGNYPTAATEVEESVKRRKQESSPAELILNFAERNFVPSEINLNKMFRRFGPLMESETEVDYESGRAKVIFKRGADAEVARNSSEKFNIFGPALVNYQIGYSPLISVKILPLELPQGPEDATLLL